MPKLPTALNQSSFTQLLQAIEKTNDRTLLKKKLTVRFEDREAVASGRDAVVLLGIVEQVLVVDTE